jgi:hypothetical protein
MSPKREWTYHDYLVLSALLALGFLAGWWLAS